MKKESLSRTTILKAAWIIYALVSLIFWLPKVDQMISKDYDTISQYVSIDDHWDITINDVVYRDVSLEDFSFEPVVKGDRILMERTLPESWPMTEGALRVHIRQTGMEILIDDVKVYEYGMDRIAAGKTVGSGLKFINFPTEYQGKNIKIYLYVFENKAFTKLDSIQLFEWENAYRALVTEYRLPMLLGCFLIVFGILTCVITIFALAFSIKYLRIFCISLFSLFMGIWTLCYYNVISIFSIPLYSKSLLEYIMLYICPLPLITYMHEDVKNLKNRLLKTLYWILLSVQITTTAVTMTLHTFDLVHFAATLKYIQALIICYLAFFILIEIMNLKSNRATSRIYLVGILIILFCISYDMFNYHRERFYGASVSHLIGMSSIGVIVFISILVGSFYIDMTQKMMQDAERNFLIKSAYTDELTQIHNRRYCMEYMQKIEENKLLGYTVICFDVNNLKIINDTFGHAKGDILIKSAAEVIAETFEQYGIVARMGGDEFIAIIETYDADKVNALMTKFRENVLKKNKIVGDLEISIACGYASGMVQENNIEKIYQEADNLMYENKKRMKAASKNT